MEIPNIKGDIRSLDNGSHAAKGLGLRVEDPKGDSGG